jgi:hypothetical protein
MASEEAFDQLVMSVVNDLVDALDSGGMDGLWEYLEVQQPQRGEMADLVRAFVQAVSALVAADRGRFHACHIANALLAVAAFTLLMTRQRRWS